MLIVKIVQQWNVNHHQSIMKNLAAHQSLNQENAAHPSKFKNLFCWPWNVSNFLFAQLWLFKFEEPRS